MTTQRKTIAILAALALAWAPAALHAQTAAEQAELDADAAGVAGPRPVPSGLGGIQCPAGTNPAAFYFNDFETDDGGWTGGGDAPWEWGTVTTGVFENCDTVPEDEPAGAFSGTDVWATNLDGCYTNSGTESLLSQTFDFSGLSAPIELSWWNWYEVFVSFDMAEVIVNGGTPLFEVTTTAPTGTYIQESVNLDGFAGNPSVTIDFRLFATTVVNRSGWYIDDVMIETCLADADVELTKSVDPTNPAPGENIVYTLTATNNGPGDATGVVVTDDLPMGVTYQSNDCGASFTDPTVTWNVGALANGASAVCNVTATVDVASGDLVNNASVSAGSNDPVPANNTASAQVTVGQPVQEIPTLGTLGIVLLALLLAVTAALALRRRGGDQVS